MTATIQQRERQLQRASQRLDELLWEVWRLAIIGKPVEDRDHVVAETLSARAAVAEAAEALEGADSPLAPVAADWLDRFEAAPRPAG